MRVSDDRRIVEIWLSNAENNDSETREDLRELYSRYKTKKYTVAVYESGGVDLYQSTLALLEYNRKRSAEQDNAKNNYSRQTEIANKIERPFMKY